MAEDRHDHMESNLTPSALILRLMPGPSPADWQVTRRYPDRSQVDSQAQTPQLIPAPWARANSFFQTLASFWQLSRQGLAETAAIQMLHTHAAAIGDQLAHVLTDQDRAYLSALEADTPFLIIESADATILSLPWELLRLQDRFAVREGRLDVARSVFIDAPPAPAPPTTPFTLVMTVAAPDPSALDEERERYQLLRAVPTPMTPVLNETGEFEELLASVSAAPPRFGIHFSGPGGNGKLCFEDASGQSRSIPVENLQHALRTTAPERQPQFFFLALDYDGVSSSQGPAREKPWLARTSTALKLHRTGIPQVVVHDRAVLDHASLFVEPAALNALYSVIAQGRNTRDAVRAARRILTAPSDGPTRPAEFSSAAPSASNGVQPYAWTHLLYFHRGLEYPLCAPAAQPDGATRHTASKRPATAPLMGRRKALHSLRRRRQTQDDITVVQGLTGVGKTAFCEDALQLYKRLGYAILTLRCGEAEFDPQPLNTLLWQCTQAASQLAGAQWPTLCAMMDESVADQREIPSLTARFLMLLQVLMQRPGHPRLVLYLDNLESLMSRPSKGSTARHWRQTDVAEFWHALVQSAQETDGQLAILASCRCAHPDLQPYLLPLRPLAPDAVWSLLDRLPALRRLAPGNRHRLLKRIDGYPQVAILLDALLPHTHISSAPDQPTPDAAREEWRQVIAPVLPTQNQPLSERSLFKAIWSQQLDEPTRCLLARATVLRAPADVSLMHALALEAEDTEAANRILDRLCAFSLLETIKAPESDSGSGDPERYFSVKPGIARLVRQQISQVDTLIKQGHVLAGEVFEDRAWHANNPHAAFEASYHLVEVDEADRGFELLLGLVQWLHSRHRLLDSLTALDALRWPEALSLHNRTRLLIAQGQTYAGLDNLPEALSHLQRAVGLYAELAEQALPDAQRPRGMLDRRERIGDVLVALGKGAEALATYQARLSIAERLAAQDPENPQWQRELSANHVRIGDVLAALGEGDGALASYQVRLAVAERMATQDPANPRWQQELASSYSRLGDMLAGQGQQSRAMAAYQAGRAIYARLVEQAPTNLQWQQHLALSQEKVGDMFAAQGHTSEALAAYRVGMSQRAWLAERAPTNLSLQRDLALSREKIGELLANQHRYSEALTAYRSGLVIRTQLVQRDADQPHWQQELAAAHAKLADLFMTLNQQAEALAAYQAELAVRARLVAREPDNVQWQRERSVCHNKIGDILAAQGQEHQALAAYRDSLAIRLQLVSQDPENLQWQRDLSVSQEKVGDILALQGQEEDALAAYRKSLAFRTQLASQDPTHVQWQRDLSVCHNKIGDILSVLGDKAGALASYRDDLAIAERLAAQEPSDTRRQTDLVVSYWKLAQINASTRKNATESAALLGLGLTILRRLQSEARLPPSQAHWLDEFEQALQALSSSRRSGKFPRAARAVWRKLSRQRSG